tara:strand:- start:218 stop:415 length:198 start_codon:yes stop_codon:yes gene_type:complete
MKEGDLIRNIHTDAVALITQKITRPRSWSTTVTSCDYEIFISGENKTLVAPCGLVEEHWEIIDED